MREILKKRIVIIGAGTAGITVAARLQQSKYYVDVTVVDPSDKHYYQPLWTFVGAGVFKASDSVRDEASVIPKGVTWIKQRVTAVDAQNNLVVTDAGDRIEYDALVVCPGIQINWNHVKGLEETLGRNGVCSNYSYDSVPYTWQCIESFSRGVAIFTDPKTVVKCGGAPQKICYLADDYFRQNGVRQNVELIYISGKPKLFTSEHYAKTLREVVRRKQIETRFNLNLIEVDGAAKEATFEQTETGEKVIVKFDMLHVSPPMGPPAFIAASGLGDTNGWVDVDKHTLQHTRFANVFSLGDCSSLPTSKTGAAIRKQAPVVVANLLAYLQDSQPVAKYDGYTSCPLITGYKGLILAEFNYDLKPQETFPFDQNKERYSMYLLKKYVLPRLYWDSMLKGRG
jgi:sulfide:quinone oxidoreductase